MRVFLQYIFGVIFLCFPLVSSAEFVISSVFPNTFQDTTDEYIEIINTGKESLNLEGYRISDISGKEYIFGAIVFSPGESQRFHRPQTKILLNNSNEELYLKNIHNVIIDQVSYISTVKGEPIEFFVLEDYVISDESYLQIFFSDEAEIQEKETEPSPELYTLPEKVIIDFQQPTYLLEKPSEENIYTCDSEKETCKVNFDFRESFSSELKASDYVCYITDNSYQEEIGNCNPATMVFSPGEHEVVIRIQHKDSEEYFIERTIYVNSGDTGEQEKDISEEISYGSPDGSESLGNEENSIVLFPEQMLYTLQQPSYVSVLESGIISCDRNRETCKINFDFRETFSEGFSQGDFYCELDFSFLGEILSTCNPSTLEIPIGEHVGKFKIISQQESSLYKEFSFSLRNEGYISKNFQKTEIKKPKIQLMQPNIEIQSGIDSYRNCVSENCKINLKYEKNFSQEKCIWNFGDGIYKESTRFLCNPGYVSYPSGEHIVTLRVYQTGNTENYKETSIRFISQEKEYISILEKEDTTPSSIPQQELHILQSSIKLQGKKSQNKTLSGSILTCFTDDMCNINLIAQYEFSAETSAIRYIWDMGNGEKYDGSNPSSYNYDIGEYIIRLKVYDDINLIDEQVLTLKITPFTEEKQKGEEVFVFTGSLQIHSIFPNPVGRDSKEWIEIQNIGQDISLSGCFLERGSKKYHFPQDSFIQESEVLRIFAQESRLTLPNNQGVLYLKCGEEIIDSLTWNNYTGEQDIITHDGEIQYISMEEAYPYKYFQENSYISLRILKSGVKISGETIPYAKIYFTSNQGHRLVISSDKNGLFQYTQKSLFIPGEIQFTGIFNYKNSEFVFLSEKETISQQDINNFFQSSIPRKKTTTKNQEKKIDFSQVVTNQYEQQIGYTERFYVIFVIVILGFFVLVFFLFLYHHIQIRSYIVYVSQVIFSTKQKINLII